ncbi:hypothetical protein [Nocardiopsis sp. YSL2]|uniref:hypothetical protein n=1 Tax=Nocardiopsis sp. YSL2 TaxID=2939492 RepID=UPI0026F40CCA|nr:hypothetical protein [Nocardiopsis sp. YSL2]
MRYLTYVLLLTQRLACAGAAELRRRRDRDRSEPGPAPATGPVRVILPSMMTGRRAPDLPLQSRATRPAEPALAIDFSRRAQARHATGRGQVAA